MKKNFHNYDPYRIPEASKDNDPPCLEPKMSIEEFDLIVAENFPAFSWENTQNYFNSFGYMISCQLKGVENIYASIIYEHKYVHYLNKNPWHLHIKLLNVDHDRYYSVAKNLEGCKDFILKNLINLDERMCKFPEQYKEKHTYDFDILPLLSPPEWQIYYSKNGYI